FLAMVTSRHPPQYFFVGADSADLHFDPSRLPAGWREAVEVVHFGSISLVREPLAGRLVEEARAAHAAGKRVAFDPNFRATMKAPAYAATLAEMLGLADYVKVSDEDLLGLFPSLDADAALAHLRNAAPAADILYTRGADGMSLLSGGKVYEQPAFRVEVADTVGCGDASMAGWIVGLIERAGAPAALQLRWSAACAALAATRHGPYAPTHAEVEQLLAHQALLSA
ncbi:MAG: carbohydrate kinase, partial [Rhodocyclaceae bacterium]|nr:carbohydrate kinase [Rhodocyclaceae bacterium]